MTAKAIDSIEKELLKNNEEYKKLHADHLVYESQLEKFSPIKVLTPDEDLEFKRLKKLKLQGKDRMGQILAEAREKA
jgi:hypothetical protein